MVVVCLFWLSVWTNICRHVTYHLLLYTTPKSASCAKEPSCWLPNKRNTIQNTPTVSNGKLVQLYKPFLTVVLDFGQTHFRSTTLQDTIPIPNSDKQS